MILLDTHIWVWWVNKAPRFTPRMRALLLAHASTGLGISVISCWEVAQLVARNRLGLDRSAEKWMEGALGKPGVVTVEFTPQIAIAANQLPEPFHRDPADQILVATARTLGIPMLTVDTKILNYPHVQTL